MTFSDDDEIINPGKELALILSWCPSGPPSSFSYRFLYPTEVLFFPCAHYRHLCSCFAEDVDPSVGRFRNMVQTAVVPVKVWGDFLISTLHWWAHFLLLRNRVHSHTESVSLLSRSRVCVSQLSFLPFPVKPSFSFFFSNTWDQWWFFFSPKKKHFVEIQYISSRHQVILWEMWKMGGKNESLPI